MSGQTYGSVRILLQIEGGVVAAAAIWAYAQSGASWWLFAALILAPDLGMVGYLRSPAFGARIYNLAHTYALPVALAFLGVVVTPAALPVALIWIAHIGIDRALGYGLKYPGGFRQTHLGGDTAPST